MANKYELSERVQEITQDWAVSFFVDGMSAEELEKSARDEQDGGNIYIYVSDSYSVKATDCNPQEEYDFLKTIHTLKAADFIDFELLAEEDFENCVLWEDIDEEINSIFFD